jgi:hypothetical protein
MTPSCRIHSELNLDGRSGFLTSDSALQKDPYWPYFGPTLKQRGKKEEQERTWKEVQRKERRDS